MLTPEETERLELQIKIREDIRFILEVQEIEDLKILSKFLEGMK